MSPAKNRFEQSPDPTASTTLDEIVHRHQSGVDAGRSRRGEDFASSRTARGLPVSLTGLQLVLRRYLRRHFNAVRVARIRRPF